MLVVENYPDLKANQNFLALQEELTGTENKIAFARQNYNDQVLFYNNRIQMFPSNVVAGMFAFTKRDFFEVEDGRRARSPEGQLRVIVRSSSCSRRRSGDGWATLSVLNRPIAPGQGRIGRLSCDSRTVQDGQNPD